MTTWGGQRVLFITAHPDDVEGTSGGLVSILTGTLGAEIYYLITTNGDKGCSAQFCQNSSSDEIALIRYRETLSAAKVLTVPSANVAMLHYSDSMLTATSPVEVRMRYIAAIRALKPYVVITWLPTPKLHLRPSQGWYDFGYHPDHQYVGGIALEAVGSANIERLYPELGPAHAVKEFYMFSFSDDATHYVDITGVPLQMKIKAFLSHKSQYSSPTDLSALLTSLGERLGQGLGVQVAERFLAFW